MTSQPTRKSVFHISSENPSLATKLKEATVFEDPSMCEKISIYFSKEGVKICWMLFWLITNLGLFAWKFEEYYVGEKSFAFKGLSWGAPIARASAVCISFNSALMLVTVLRGCLSWIRETGFGDLVPVDKNLVFHRYIAAVILFFTVMHITAHMFNYLALESAPLEKLAYMGYTEHTPAYVSLFMRIPGVTGIVATLVMILMYTSAMKAIRSPMFNLFWFMHHLFVVYYIALSIHGTARMMEHETFYYWVCGPAFLYLIERTLRVIRGSTPAVLRLAIAHPSKVLELQFRKSAFHYRPGQYLFLNCPYISEHEWHPFTISSAPEEEIVSVHIRIVGDWTTDLWNFINPGKKLGVVQENIALDPEGRNIFRIDGPFGAASEHVFTHNFQTMLLVAGGIGATPFSSILKSIRYKIDITGATSIKKVYFYWISRDKNSFEWFNEILAALENENTNNFLEINVYLTQAMRLSQIREVMYGADESGMDSVTGLQSPTHFGRPDWDNIFTGIVSKHIGQRIGVFFCGPSPISKQLDKSCRKFTCTKSGTSFIYHKENF